MNACPKCHYQPLPDQAKFCPNCSLPLDIARINVGQEVQQNYGSVIGIRTDAVNGDVYGGDIYQVQVYVLSEASRPGFGQRLLDENTSPYKYLAPYGPLDSKLFKGREKEIQDLLLDLGIFRMLVLYGSSGVGKTSLLSAGVIPRIIESGALAVHVRDYAQPLVETLRAALSASRDRLPLDLPEDSSLAQLLQSVTSSTQGTLVLVLDQFETLFRPPISPELGAAQINALIESLTKIEPQYLRLILSVRDDSLVRLGDLQNALPDMFRAFRPLKPLSRKQASQAILEPLKEVPKRIFYEEGFVDQVLIPDLDNLSPEDPDTIHPTHLQIICEGLYREAVGRQPPLVTRSLYWQELHGAQGILHSYFQQTLESLGEQRSLAETIFVTMATPGASEWVSPDSLHVNGSSPAALESVLKRLADSGLLASRQSDQGTLYAFAGQPVLDEVYHLAGEEIEQRVLAAKELERIWAAWATNGELASSQQMRRLSAYGTHLAPSPLEGLLLIRSAQAANQPAAPWLASLNSLPGRSLVRELEGLPEESQTWHFSESELVQASALLGIKKAEGTPVKDASGDTAYGPLASSAVTLNDPPTYQTDALALLTAGQHTAVDRLNWALQDLASGLHRQMRRVELRGAMAEADPEAARLNTSLPALDRALIWGWRVQRRISARLDFILTLTLGAAAGAGLGLGLLRFFTALLTGKTPGLFLVLNIFFGGLLGGAVTLAILLSGFLRLSSPLPPGQRSPSMELGTSLRAVPLGVLLFALAQGLIVATTGRLSLSGKEVVFGLGLFAGLGLCLALYLPPGPPFWERPGLWPLRISAVALLFTLIQGVFLFNGDLFNSLVILLPAADYRANFIGFAWIPGIPGWYLGLAMLDALLAGALLTSGLLLGANWAFHFFQSWRRI